MKGMPYLSVRHSISSELMESRFPTRESLNTSRDKGCLVSSQNGSWQEDAVNIFKARQVRNDTHDAFGTVPADALRRLAARKVQATRLKVLEVLMRGAENG